VAAVQLHPREQLLLQDRHVAGAVHRLADRQEVEAGPPPDAGEAGPDHDGRRMLHRLHGELGEVPVGTLAPPHPRRPGVDQPEGRLVREHGPLPVVGRQVEVAPAEAKPLSGHLLGQERLSSGRPGRDVQPLLQNLLETPDGHVLEARDLSLELLGRLERMEGDVPPQPLVLPGGRQTGAARPLLGWRGRGRVGKVPQAAENLPHADLAPPQPDRDVLAAVALLPPGENTGLLRFSELFSAGHGSGD